MNQLGMGRFIADPGWDRVRERLAAIYGKEREQLEKLGLWWVGLEDVIPIPPSQPRLPEG